MPTAIESDSSHSATFPFTSFTSTFELTVIYVYNEQQASVVCSYISEQPSG